MTRGDWLILVLMMALVGTSTGVLWGDDGGAPARVQVRVSGELVQTLPLNRDRRLRVDGLLGESELEIRDGRVRFVDSPCSNQQCIIRGWVHRSGDMVACLPNRVSVSIVGEQRWFDAVNF